MSLRPQVRPYLGRSGLQVSFISTLGVQMGTEPAGQQLGKASLLETWLLSPSLGVGGQAH